MKKTITFIIVSVVFCLVCTGCVTMDKNEAALSKWTENSVPAAALIEYVNNVTDEKSADFIPQKDRIAVFDLDGTLYCETFPIYGEWILYSDYVLNNPDAVRSEKLRDVAEELASIKKASDIPSYMEENHIHSHAAAFAGMPIEDYYKVVDSFKETKAEGYNGMLRGDAFYQPMLQVVDYLIENDFIVYICSGTNRFTVRGLIRDYIDIPPRQVIGTDFTIVADGQGDTTDMHYNFTEEDRVLMGDSLITKNIKMSKVAQLEQEIGQKPVLIFGNSTGDTSMAVYAETGNKYQTGIFFLLCDDTVRENGNIKKAKRMEDICREKGWYTISMKNDWTTIFGDNVTTAP